MKKIVFIITCFAIWTSCTEVIQVDLPTEEPRLVVEADLLWDKGTTGDIQQIKLTLSSDFYDENNIVTVTNAQVKVINESSGEVFDFLSIGNGIYQCTNFNPQFNNKYILDIQYNGESYRGEEQFVSVVDIDYTDQSTSTGFDGDDEISIDTYITDPADEINFYHVSHDVNHEDRAYISIWDDEFQNGNQFAIIYQAFFTGREDFELEAGDTIDITISGISQTYGNYMYILTDQAYNTGDPFAPIPVQLQGNVLNLTHPEKRAYGYFRLSEQVKDQFIVQ